MENKEDRLDKQHALTTQIIKRFMSAEEWAEFKREYFANMKNSGMKTRKQSLGQNISKQDLSMLIDYVEDVDTVVSEIAKRHSMPAGTVGNKAGRIALKLLHQNPELLARFK